MLLLVPIWRAKYFCVARRFIQYWYQVLIQKRGMPFKSQSSSERVLCLQQQPKATSTTKAATSIHFRYTIATPLSYTATSSIVGITVT